VVLLAAVVAVVLGLVCWWQWPDRTPHHAPEDMGATKPEPPVVAALKVQALKVIRHPELDEDADELGEMGVVSFVARPGDRVQVLAELSEPAHAYLIAFNTDGTEQLLWPHDEKGKPDPSRRPPLRRQLRYHPLNDDLGFGLDDRPGGVQAFAVAASRKPLPAYEQWRKRREAKVWRRVLARRVAVWSSDGEDTFTYTPDRPGKRGRLDAQLPGVPPLRALCRWLKADGVEATEAIAFGVRAKE
jgi:hypothetical protein